MNRVAPGPVESSGDPAHRTLCMAISAGTPPKRPLTIFDRPRTKARGSTPRQGSRAKSLIQICPPGKRPPV